MQGRSLLGVALVGTSLVGISMGAAQLGLRNDGVEFSDGTVQSSAAETPGEFVQASATVTIPDAVQCAEGNIYTVPASKRLRVEWISIKVFQFGADDFDPVDIDIKTWLAGVQVTHFLERIDGAIFFPGGISGSARRAWPIVLYNQGNTSVSIRACRSTMLDDTDVVLTLHGQLFKE